jgi:ubiquinol-cytochrome c reductase iron-sulfur subunit
LNIHDKPKLQLAHITTNLHSLTMRPLASAAGPAVRSWTKHSLPSARVAPAVVTTPQRRSQSEYAQSSSFDSPFKGADSSPTTNVPSFKKYMSKNSETSNRVFQYFMVGSMGLLTAAGAKATVQGEKSEEVAL